MKKYALLYKKADPVGNVRQSILNASSKAPPILIKLRKLSPYRQYQQWLANKIALTKLRMSVKAETRDHQLAAAKGFFPALAHSMDFITQPISTINRAVNYPIYHGLKFIENSAKRAGVQGMLMPWLLHINPGNKDWILNRVGDLYNIALAVKSAPYLTQGFDKNPQAIATSALGYSIPWLASIPVIAKTFKYSSPAALARQVGRTTGISNKLSPAVKNTLDTFSKWNRNAFIAGTSGSTVDMLTGLTSSSLRDSDLIKNPNHSELYNQALLYMLKVRKSPYFKDAYKGTVLGLLKTSPLSMLRANKILPGLYRNGTQILGRVAADTTPYWLPSAVLSATDPTPTDFPHKAMQVAGSASPYAVLFASSAFGKNPYNWKYIKEIDKDPHPRDFIKLYILLKIRDKNGIPRRYKNTRLLASLFPSNIFLRAAGLQDYAGAGMLLSKKIAPSILKGFMTGIQLPSNQKALLLLIAGNKSPYNLAYYMVPGQPGQKKMYPLLYLKNLKLRQQLGTYIQDYLKGVADSNDLVLPVYKYIPQTAKALGENVGQLYKIYRNREKD